MFGKVFGRKDDPVQGTQAGTSGTVIVPERATDSAADLAQAVVEFINYQRETGLYRPAELPGMAMQSYHADFYLAQVNNGGHSQFVHNAGAAFQAIASDAKAGLEAMGAGGQAQTLRDLIAWVAANPEEAGAQTGFTGGRAAALDALDERFYAEQKAAPMTEANAAWIRSWPELRIVKDDTYAAAMRENAMLNPLREDRLVAAGIRTCRHWLSEPVRFGTGLAAMSAEPGEVLTGIGNGSRVERDGRSAVAWTVETNAGRRFSIVTEERVELLDAIVHDNGPAPDMSDPDSMKAAMDSGYFQRFRAPEPGEVLARRTGEEIRAAMTLAQNLEMGAGIDLLLRRHGKSALGATITMAPPSEMVDPNVKALAIVVVEGTAYRVVFIEGGALLHEIPSLESRAQAASAEIADHARKADA